MEWETTSHFAHETCFALAFQLLFVLPTLIFELLQFVIFLAYKQIQEQSQEWVASALEHRPAAVLEDNLPRPRAECQHMGEWQMKEGQGEEKS